MTNFTNVVLMFAPTILLVAGACAVAVWASRLPNEQSSLVARLTGQTHDSARPATQREEPD